MAFVHGTSSRVLVNEMSVSSYVSGWTATHSRALSEVTALPDGGARNVPGLTGGTIALRGPSDTNGTSSIHTEINSGIGVDNVLQITILPDGTAVGQPAITAMCDPGEYAIDASVSDAVGYALSAMPDRSVDMGFVAHPLSAETVDGNSTVVDRGAAVSTTAGAVASLHVTAYSGLTNAIIKVQTSPDNSAWTTLSGATFTTVTAIGSELLTVATGVTIQRYVRVNLDVTGTGSITYLVAFCPR